MKTVEEFDKKWKDHLEEGNYGLAIDDEKVIEYLDKKFTELKEKYPNFTYSQIKLKFTYPRVYMEPNEINTSQIEDDIHNILLSKNPFKKGDKVYYIPFPGADPTLYENGIVKEVHSGYTCHVVFKCNNDWDNYENYTGQSTYVKDLNTGWYEQ